MSSLAEEIKALSILRSKRARETGFDVFLGHRSGGVETVKLVIRLHAPRFQSKTLVVIEPRITGHVERLRVQDGLGHFEPQVKTPHPAIAIIREADPERAVAFAAAWAEPQPLRFASCDQDAFRVAWAALSEGLSENEGAKLGCSFNPSDPSNPIPRGHRDDPRVALLLHQKPSAVFLAEKNETLTVIQRAIHFKPIAEPITGHEKIIAAGLLAQAAAAFPKLARHPAWGPFLPRG